MTKPQEREELLAWDDEDGQAYVLGTHDVDRARAYYRDVYLPEIWGKDRQDSEEWKWGVEVTESTPEAIWVHQDEVEEERWHRVERSAHDDTELVLIWRGL